MLESLQKSEDIYVLISDKNISLSKLAFPELQPRSTKASEYNELYPKRSISLDRSLKEPREAALNISHVKINLDKEIRDPGNSHVLAELEKLVHLNQNLKSAQQYFEQMKRSKSLDDKSFDKLSMKDAELSKKKYNYNCKNYNYLDTSYLKGLSKMINDFLEKQAPKSSLISLNQSKTSSKNNLGKFIASQNSCKEFTKSNGILSTISKAGSISPKKSRNLNPVQTPSPILESLYSKLGHEVYSKLINVFEKYCLFGKTHTNFYMDFQQFSVFTSQNEIYNDSISRTQGEFIFNRVRKENKCKLKYLKIVAITFEEFIDVLIQFSQIIFSWEKDPLKSFSYFSEQYLINIPCLKLSFGQKNLERWYFFLESQEFSLEIKKHLSRLHKVFLKYKLRDLRVSECVNTEDFLKMSKEMSIVPVFLSSKEVITVINFVKYRKKSLLPTNNFDFCTFVEAVCVIALQSLYIYLQGGQGQKHYDHIEKLRTFLNYINDKV